MKTLLIDTIYILTRRKQYFILISAKCHGITYNTIMFETKEYRLRKRKTNRNRSRGSREWHSSHKKALDWYSPLFAVKFDSHIRENEMQENHQRHKSFFECPRAAISRFRSIFCRRFVPGFVCVKNWALFTTIAFREKKLILFVFILDYWNWLRTLFC